jgi:hypothetical protein
MVDDEKPYVMKPLNNHQHPRVVLNELLGARLMNLIAVPNAGGWVADVPAEVGSALAYNGTDGVLGPAFCNLLVDPSFDQADEIMKNLTDSCAIAKAVVAATWAVNHDGRQVRFVRVAGTESYSPIFIDQGFYFGNPVWGRDSLQRTAEDRTVRGVLPGTTLPPRGCFDQVLEDLARIEVEDLQAMTEDVPDEWSFSEEDREALIDYLLRRARLVPEVMSEQMKRGLP